MFIATMYSFGRDPACVGVDGIITCMGVFLAYGNRLYAIHVPFQNDDTNKQGREAFITYVRQQEPGFKGKNAKLYGVTNNTARPSAEDELRGYKKSLNCKYTVFVRLRNHVDNATSAAVVCEFLLGGKGPVLKYRRHDTAGWQTGAGGTARAGYYKNGSMDSIFTTANTDVASGWHLVNAGNSELKLL